MNFYLINPDAEHRGILLIKEKVMFLIDVKEVKNAAGISVEKALRRALVFISGEYITL